MKRHERDAARPMVHGGTSFAAHEVRESSQYAPTIRLLLPTAFIGHEHEPDAPPQRVPPAAESARIATPAEDAQDRSRGMWREPVRDTRAAAAPRPAAVRRGRAIEVISRDHRVALRARAEKMRPDTRRMVSGFLDRLDAHSGVRKLVRVPRHIGAKLANLRAEMPNFASAIAMIEKHLVLRSAGDGAVQLPPLLLDGPPGIGKTRFTKRLAEVLGVGYTRVGMETTTAGWVLAGSSTSWADGKPGAVANLLADSPMANALLFLDEIDKASSYQRFDPLGPLYALLESHTARAWVDEAIEGVTFDASRLNIVAAANDTVNLPEALRSRFLIVPCRSPDRAERAAIAQVAYRELVIELGLRGPAWRAPLATPVADQLAAPEDAPRQMRRMLQGAMASAVQQGRAGLTIIDAMLAALECLPAVDPATTPEKPRPRGPGDGFARAH